MCRPCPHCCDWVEGKGSTSLGVIGFKKEHCVQPVSVDGCADSCTK